MSLPLYQNGGLRFWTEEEILLRNQFTERLVLAMRKSLCAINSAWNMVQCEGPILTPHHFLSPEYTSNDAFFLADTPLVLRPETTASSYQFAQEILNAGKMWPPLVVWQLGKSFRRELNDGATASKLRFNEFYQLEFQCIYSADSKADYMAAVLEPLSVELSRCTSRTYRNLPSDRLPSYSQTTFDIELFWREDFKEVASLSLRTDFPEQRSGKKLAVLEVAIGMDRLVCIARAQV